MRTESSIKNIKTGILLQIVTVVFGFIARKVFVSYMGIELLGINGLLSNVISMLSLVELGVGTAIFYSLYKPLAEKDYNQVHAIMNLYEKLYRYIAIAVLTLGVLITPFLKYFVNTNISMSYVKLIYFIFVIDSALSYILTYRRNILLADQKMHIFNRLSVLYSIGCSIAQIGIIIITKNYILYLVIKIVLVLIQNLQIYRITNKRYPYLNETLKEPLKKEIKNDIIKNTKALLVINIAAYFVFGTDNILLSYFLGVSIVGIYSNYSIIVSTIEGLILRIFQGIQASFGNFLLEESLDKAYEIFNVLYFVNFWISTFCSVSLIVLLNPFIEIVFGEDMLFSIVTIFFIVYNFYIKSMTSSVEVVKNGAGLYSPYPFAKYWSIVEGILNLVASIILVKYFKLGALGVFAGTTISRLVTLIIDPFNVHRYIFKTSIKNYFFKYIEYTSIFFVITGLVIFITKVIAFNNLFVEFIFKGICCIIIPNTIILLLFFRSKEFKYLIGKFNILNKLLKKFNR